MRIDEERGQGASLYNHSNQGFELNESRQLDYLDFNIESVINRPSVMENDNKSQPFVNKSSKPKNDFLGDEMTYLTYPDPRPLKTLKIDSTDEKK